MNRQLGPAVSNMHNLSYHRLLFSFTKRVN
jgi:hypothetical protein